MNKKFSIKIPEDFNFQACLQFLQRSDLECLFFVKKECVFFPIEIQSQIFIVQVLGKKDRLEIEILNADLFPEGELRIKDYILEWFDIRRDLTAFNQMCSNDFLLKNINLKHRGLRLIGIPNLTEALSWAIIGQQINLTFAYTLKKRLIENFGKKIKFERNDFFLFPSAKTISQLTENDLRPFQFSRSKIKYLTGVTKAIAENEISKKHLSQIPYKEAKTLLLSYKGIGNWTADYVLMKCIRSTNAFPITDVGLHNAIKKQLNLKQKPSLEEIEQWSDNWKGWEAYATFYLWHSLL